jgi:hypothetical protein
MLDFHFPKTSVARFHAARLNKKLLISMAEVLRSKKIREHNARLQQLRRLTKEKLIAAQVSIGSPLSVADIDLLIDRIEKL